MVPLKDYNPGQRTPYMTYGLIVLNLSIFLYGISLSPADLSAFFQTWAVIPQALSASVTTGLSVPNAAEWMTLITSQFLHGGLLHLPLKIPAIVYLGLWFLQQAVYGFVSLETPTMIGMEGGGIAYWAHAGGFAIGAGLGPLFGLFSQPDTPTALLPHQDG